MTINNAKFNIGQLVVHKKFHYRGVIIDVDPDFQGTEEWYNQVATSRPSKQHPWYHVLVDNKDHQTYVAEQNLREDRSLEPIQHPMINFVFSGFNNGTYEQEKYTH